MVAWGVTAGIVARASVTSRASLLAPPPPLELLETTVMVSVSAMAEETRWVTSGSWWMILSRNVALEYLLRGISMSTYPHSF